MYFSTLASQQLLESQKSWQFRHLLNFVYPPSPDQAKLRHFQLRQINFPFYCIKNNGNDAEVNFFLDTL